MWVVDFSILFCFSSLSGSFVSLLEGASEVILGAAVPPGETGSFGINSGAIFGVSRTVEGSGPEDEWIPGITLDFHVLMVRCPPMGHHVSFFGGRVVPVGTPCIAVGELIALVATTGGSGG